MSEHFRRMVALADEFFETKNDPEQLDVNEEVIEQLLSIHPFTLSQHEVGDGPVCWILLIPSSLQTMNDFLSGKISEKNVLEQALQTKKPEAIYLCSALVLPEFRNQGIAKRLTLEAIKAMRDSFPITILYAWPFSEEGSKLSELISKETQLPLRLKN